jgi:hypothetical protein
MTIKRPSVCIAPEALPANHRRTWQRRAPGSGHATPEQLAQWRQAVDDLHRQHQSGYRRAVYQQAPIDPLTAPPPARLPEHLRQRFIGMQQTARSLRWHLDQPTREGLNRFEREVVERQRRNQQQQYEYLCRTLKGQLINE